MIGMIPGTFTVTSHIIVTVALALVVFLHRAGLRLLQERLEIPEAVRAERHSDLHPAADRADRADVVPVAAAVARVRLFANMLAGHITLKVFAGFIPMLGGLGVLGWLGAVLPLGMTVALTALEFLVAFLQAYVFTILTCIYINDAIHPGH